MLTVDNTADYLIGRRLIGIESILDGDLTISSAARRNRNLRVKRARDIGYLIKQPDDGAGGAQQTLRAEAAFYSFCQSEPAVAEVRAVLPRLAHYEDPESVLVFELVRDARPLWTHYNAHEPARFPIAAARATGAAMATVHRVFRLPGPAADPRLAWLHRQVPWIMHAHKPSPDLLASLTPANMETLRIVQTHEQMAENLERLRKLWQPSTVIHNDIKSDNVLVTGERVFLVDWELVQIGDPAWDIAGLLQDFVLFWITSMSMTSGVPAETMVASARYPLPLLQNAIRGFWKSYKASAALEPDEASQLIARAVELSAARLIQSAYEFGQAMTMLAPIPVLLLQISANLLRNPMSGRIQLYGLLEK